MKTIRKIKRNLTLFTINLIGISLAVTCGIIVSLYAKKELSYDKFHTNADRIYRITLERNNGAVSMHPARIGGNWINDFIKDYPQIEKFTGVQPYRNAIVKIQDKIFYSEQSFSADTNFFDIFNFKVLKGNGREILQKPQTALITQSLAKKYFGTDDVVGKTLLLTHQLERETQEYTIGGVMEDVPDNSHFHIDILTSKKQLEGNRTEWSYTYCLVKPQTNLQEISQQIEQKIQENKKNEVNVKIHFQKLTDIHLHSNKSRELEQNGSLRSLILLISGILIVLFIALINFYNLSRVQFIAEIKSVKVKIVNGATKWNIIKEKLQETVPLLGLSILFSFIIVYLTADALKSDLWNDVKDNFVSVLVILFVLGFLTLVTALLSMVSSKITAEKHFVTKHYNSYRIPLVIQLILSIVAISETIVLNRQMDYINTLHPVAKEQNMLIIPNVPMGAAKKYHIFKQELLQNPEISDITCAMEKPGGNIVDNFPFQFEGLDKTENKTIKVLTVDSNFFSMMKIKPIAGTVNLTKPANDWEQKAIQIGMARMSNQKISQDIVDEVKGYKGTYVINKSTIKLLGLTNPQNAINKEFELTHPFKELFPKGKIIGVVPNFHYTNLFNKEEPMVIFAKQMFSKWFIIKLNTSETNTALAKINATWENIYPNYPFRYEFMSDNYKTIYQGEYIQTKVLSFFALVSILLSAIGIFALAQFSIQRRTKEIGIRKINGATITEILTMLNKDFVKWVVIAFLIATPTAYYAMNKWLENFAYKTVLSWWIFALAGLSALLIVLITVSWQSYKTASQHPIKSLKYE